MGWIRKIRIKDTQRSVSFTEEGMVSEKDIFEVRFKSSASEERNKFDSKDSAGWGAIGEQSKS